MDHTEIQKNVGMSILDIFTAAISVCHPTASVMGAAAHGLDVVLNAADCWNAKKIDLFIAGVNRDARAAENFRMLLFNGPRREEHALRLINDIFHMETERKVEYFSFAGINFSNDEKRKYFTETDFFRVGFILANTLSEDLEFMHGSNLEQALDYSENVQGLVSSGLMYPCSDDKYRFTTIAKKIDFFALDLDGTKYGIESEFSPLPAPLYEFNARFA